MKEGKTMGPRLARAQKQVIRALPCLPGNAVQFSTILADMSEMYDWGELFGATIDEDGTSWT